MSADRVGTTGLFWFAAQAGCEPVRVWPLTLLAVANIGFYVGRKPTGSAPNPTDREAAPWDAELIPGLGHAAKFVSAATGQHTGSAIAGDNDPGSSPSL